MAKTIAIQFRDKLVWAQGTKYLTGSRSPPREGALSKGHVPDTPCTIDSSSFAQFPPDATNTTQQGRHAATMRSVATIMVTICYNTFRYA